MSADAVWLTPPLLWLVAAVVMLGGAVKGLVGVGLPLVVVSSLASFLDPRQALALVVVPVVVTNCWQSLRSGLLLPVFRRFWPLILAVVLGTWAGAQVVARIDPSLLLGMLGVVVVMFSLMSLLRPALRLSKRYEVVAGPCVGMFTGLLNGLSTVNGPPLIMYLLSIGLKKDEFVGAYGLIALCGSVPLALAYLSVGILGPHELVGSTLAVIPALAGILAGERLRQRVDGDRFRRMLLVVLIFLGVNLVRRALG